MTRFKLTLMVTRSSLGLSGSDHPGSRRPAGHGRGGMWWRAGVGCNGRVVAPACSICVRAKWGGRGEFAGPRLALLPLLMLGRQAGWRAGLAPIGTNDMLGNRDFEGLGCCSNQAGCEDLAAAARDSCTCAWSSCWQRRRERAHGWLRLAVAAAGRGPGPACTMDYGVSWRRRRCRCSTGCGWCHKRHHHHRHCGIIRPNWALLYHHHHHHRLCGTCGMRPHVLAGACSCRRALPPDDFHRKGSIAHIFMAPWSKPKPHAADVCRPPCM